MRIRSRNFGFPSRKLGSVYTLICQQHLLFWSQSESEVTVVIFSSYFYISIAPCCCSAKGLSFGATARRMGQIHLLL